MPFFDVSGDLQTDPGMIRVIGPNRDRFGDVFSAVAKGF